MRVFVKVGMVGVVLGSALVTAPAQAAEVCPVLPGSVKVELKKERTSLPTGLPGGVEVCVKAGTQLTTVRTAADGWITQSAITNKKGVPLGISHYVAYVGAPTPPVEEPPVVEPPVEQPPVVEPPVDELPLPPLPGFPDDPIFVPPTDL